MKWTQAEIATGQIGNTSSQTVGGSLYQALGWKAPNIYGLLLSMSRYTLAISKVPS